MLTTFTLVYTKLATLYFVDLLLPHINLVSPLFNPSYPHFIALTLIYSNLTTFTFVYPKLLTLYLVDPHLPQVNLVLPR